MGRRLRHMARPYELAECTTRTMQGRFLLKPSKGLNELILGVLGRAMAAYPEIRLYCFVFMSNHFHMILAAPDVAARARFMGFLNSNIAKKAGPRHGWQGKFWFRSP